MKQSFYLLLLSLSFLLTACHTGTKQEGSIASFDFDQDSIICKIQAEVPEQVLSSAVGEWMVEQLGGYYTGDATDMQAIVDFYGKALSDTLLQALPDSFSGEVAYEAEMNKAYETDQFVTYSFTSYLDLGGAHPTSVEAGATFRKSDGRRLSWDIVQQNKSHIFKQMLTETLCDYFGVDDETALNSLLWDSSSHEVPLPNTPPYLMENGIVVIYQQYEIASYAMGMPGDTIPYERIKPVLTDWAQKLIAP